ncbi:MAG: DUF4386 domain-containing protein [Dehalococcoidia bacterium]
MQSPTLNPTQHKAARIAGFGYLAIIVCGIFAELIIRSSLIEPGDAAATARNIIDSEGLFRISIASDFVMLTFDALVGVALFVVFRPFNNTLAVLATVFRAVHTAMYGVVLLALLFIVQLLSGAEYVSAFSPSQVDALTLLAADVHGFGYTLALMFFAVHVGILAYLVVASGYLPKVIGYLLFFASAGYLVDGFAQLLLDNYAHYENTFAMVVFGPAFVGELALGAWLMLKGVKSPAQRSGTLAAPGLQSS